jgi:hypothetical protein
MNLQGTRVSDPDSIRSVDPDPYSESGSVSGIRIRIRNPDPDPGGQKLPTKVEKIKIFHVLKCWMFSLEC